MQEYEGDNLQEYLRKLVKIPEITMVAKELGRPIPEPKLFAA